MARHASVVVDHSEPAALLGTLRAALAQESIAAD
jgi:hypothetical protein